MRRMSKRLLTAILAVILVLGNAETLLAQSDFYVETEIRSEETTFEEQTPEADEGTGFPNDREESSAEESEEGEYIPGFVMPEDYRDPDTIEENSELLRGS